MNILISKTEACSFSSCPDKMKSYGGFDVGALAFLTLARMYPQHTFYYVGPNDIDSLENKPENLIDIETPIRAAYKQSRIDNQGKEKYEIAVDYCKDLKFDLMFCWYCRCTPIAEYKLGYLSNKGTPRIIRECEKGVSYIMAIPKAYSVPVYYLIDDIAEINKLPYDLPEPAGIWSQYSGTTTRRHYISISETVNVTSPVIYKPIERLWLMGKNKVDWRNMKKTNDFIITCNSTNDGSLDRFKYVDKWIFSHFDDTVIYGKWTSPSAMVDIINNRGLADRFVRKGMCEMEDIMFNTKYTLVIPLSKKYPDFVTQKMFSMLYYGIIPFWCKNDYDCSNSKYTSFPDYIKVESPEELLYKMNELNNDSGKYKNLLEELYTLLDDRYFNGEIMHDIFDEVLA